MESMTEHLKYLVPLIHVLEMESVDDVVQVNDWTDDIPVSERLPRAVAAIKKWFHAIEDSSAKRYLIESLVWIRSRAAPGANNTITFDELNVKVNEIIVQVGTRKFVDYFAKCSPDEQSRRIADEAAKDPYFIKQLEILQPENPNVIPRAIGHYCAAEMNRQEWYDKELYSDDELEEYERQLRETHEDVFNRGNSPEERTPEARGIETLRQCFMLGRTFTLGGRPPAGPMAEGTYHRLANEGDSIGWHPDWNTLLPKPTRKESN